MRFVNRLNLKILQSDFAIRKMPMILRSFMKIQSTRLTISNREYEIGTLIKTTERPDLGDVHRRGSSVGY